MVMQKVSLALSWMVISVGLLQLDMQIRSQGGRLISIIMQYLWSTVVQPMSRKLKMVEALRFSVAELKLK